ncbi:uncharacterized LOC103181322 precursor [Callorhinchus milii]|uniref:Ig-like domain-containing protein n=1 Tax=Callorhinchus milii TaxID=7868 RepID=A0A4W3GCW9_CALMI|nr:uncharacterized LOC103181322 precursor [Callorhinchus milii]AFK11429.1 transmembrane and immunoglobulin domain-containing protein 2-like protein [Callorhinchus milii]|eukprot:gi/632959964/ref/XP_007895920.1/ PREDICTED: uncharacterized protein LOC103181322 [Callorhinchus milii]
MQLNPYYLMFILMLHHIHLLIPIAAETTFRNNISQSPAEIEAVEGDSVTMTCSYKRDQKFESIRVEWTKESQLVLTGTSSNLSLKSTDRFSQVIRESGAILTIKNINLNDTGLYLCNVIVEIPILLKVNGNGTKLTVQERKEKNWSLVGCVVLVVVIPIIAVLYYKRRWKKHPETQVVSDAVNKINCEENRAEERNPESLSSRGSSQWMASTLYESIDYFAVKEDENKESN